MTRSRLRTKLLVSLLAVSAALTCATLLIVQHSIKVQERKEIAEDLRGALLTFHNFQQQTDTTRMHSAELLASQPELKALMTTHHPATIQDSAADIFRIAGGDLLALADRSGRIVAFHPASLAAKHGSAQDLMKRSLARGDSSQWWFCGGRLFQVYLQPIYFGSPNNNSILGVVAVGYEVNNPVAASVGRIASSQVAFWYGDSIVVSTLAPGPQSELVSRMPATSKKSAWIPQDVQLGKETFLATSLDLGPDPDSSVRLTVLKSYDQATAFLNHLNRLLLLVGLVGIGGGSLLVLFISLTFTRPLEALVGGVRALEKGNFTYPIAVRGSDEVAELTSAFNRMRDGLLTAQTQLLESERLATIGRMASSISHDLRHPLTAVVANAEFLCDSRHTEAEPQELYEEIRTAVNQITDLIDSLLEFSKGRESLRPTYGSLKQALEETIKAVKGRPEFQHVEYRFRCDGPVDGWFDANKIRRAFYNLLRNAFEAVPVKGGMVDINVAEVPDKVEIMIADNGHGIPPDIRKRLFEPFVSQGKVNGTGLGLTIAQKIFQDHGGDITLESVAAGRTVFKIAIPRPPELIPPIRDEKMSRVPTASNLT